MRELIEEMPESHYGFWTVLGFHKVDKHGDARWFCRCELCGEIYSVKGFTLRNGRSTKCRPCADRMRSNGR